MQQIKYTYFVNRFENLPVEYKTGFVEADKREPIGESTISSIALDPLLWSFMMLIIPAGLAYATIGHVNFSSSDIFVGIF